MARGLNSAGLNCWQCAFVFLFVHEDDGCGADVTVHRDGNSMARDEG